MSGVVIKYRKKRKKLYPMAVIAIALCIYAVSYLAFNGSEMGSSGLNDEDVIYRKIYVELMDKKTSISFPMGLVKDSDTVMKQLEKVLNEHPEIFWISGGARLETIGGSVGSQTILNVFPVCDLREASEMERKMNDIVASVVKSANEQCSSDYEKALYVHDYLVQNCEYDEALYESTKNAWYPQNSIENTAYGCLVDRRTMCSGYAKAYMLIMNQLGMECGYISGTADNGIEEGPHAWNYVKVDSDYYMVDVTWDDPVGASGNYCSWDYFGMSTDEILKDHKIDEDLVVPYCKGRS